MPFLHLHSKMKQTRDLFSKMKSLQHHVFSFLFFFFYWLHHVFAGPHFPDQGSNPCSLQQKHRVPTTRPPGKSLALLSVQVLRVPSKTQVPVAPCCKRGNGSQEVKSPSKVAEAHPDSLACPA